MRRDYSSHVDRFGNISVRVEIGRTAGTGVNAKPSTVAHFLRGLADDIEEGDGHE